MRNRGRSADRGLDVRFWWKADVPCQCELACLSAGAARLAKPAREQAGTPFCTCVQIRREYKMHMASSVPARGRNRGKILDAAAAAFRELGFEQTAMEEIARRAGVARGTLYYNFEAKDQIAVGIAERYRAAGYAQLLEQQAAGADAVALLNGFFGFAGTWIAENRAAAFIGTTAAIRGVGRAPDRPGTTVVLQQLVEQGQAEGLLRHDLDAAVAARLLAALLTQAALLGPDASASDVAGWPRLLLAVALDGLRPSSQAPP